VGAEEVVVVVVNGRKHVVEEAKIVMIELVETFMIVRMPSVGGCSSGEVVGAVDRSVAVLVAAGRVVTVR
jgi:hypothetical protein